MITVNKISKKFIKKINNKDSVSFYADKDISFELEKGSILGILGPNGAGKTTLLRMIAGIMEPTSGNVEIDGLNYKDNSIEIKRRIAYLSGNTRLYKDITPVELLKMCGEYYGVEKDVLDKRIKEIIKRFDMESFMHQRIEKLSTGQYQRVSIARCLVHDPDYYILDEATSGLDVISGKVIIDFIKSERDNGKGIIYSTHYMEEADSICDSIIMVNKGCVIANDSSSKLKKKTKTDNLRDTFFTLIKGDVCE